MLSAVIIILREFIEASLLVSTLFAISQQLGHRYVWFFGALLLGGLSASLYAINIASISEWFDYVGQEIVNAVLHVGIFICVAALMAYLNQEPKRHHVITAIMICCVALAMSREGAEIIIYVSTSDLENPTPTLLGSAMGAGIGLSVGALLYYFLTNLSPNIGRKVSLFLLALVSAGMLGQAALLLTQADWLPNQAPLWDTSKLLPEDSVLGELFYAIAGYEATPTPIQVAIYALGFTCLAAIAGHTRFSKRQQLSNTSSLPTQNQQKS